MEISSSSYDVVSDEGISPSTFDIVSDKGISPSTFDIVSGKDIVTIRSYARMMAEEMGFPPSHRTLIAMAISEMCRNVIEYAKTGSISITPVFKDSQEGITIVVTDNGPGIINLEKAMQDGYSTRKALGMGLPGTRRIMDHFEIHSKPGDGTKVIMSKWIPQTF